MLNKEPAVLAKVVEEIIRAAIPVALIFGLVNWNQEQTGTLLIFIGVVAGGLSLLFTRSQVVPTIVADKQLEIAKASDVTRPTSEIIQQAKEETA